jgi:hypothetical protein
MAVNWSRKIWTVQKNNANPADPVPDELYQDGASNQFWLNLDFGTTDEETASGDSVDEAVARAGFRVGAEPFAVAEGWRAHWLLVPKGKNAYDPDNLDGDTERLEGIAKVRGKLARLRLYRTEINGKEALVIRLGVPATDGAQGVATAYPD